MRRYFQGTLDFACGIYAVINALACTHSIELPRARRIFQEILTELAAMPYLFSAFCRNDTDHYWLVRCMLARTGSRYNYRLKLFQPFSNCLLPRSEEEAGVHAPVLDLYLPEKEDAAGPLHPEDARQEVLAVWEALSFWLDQPVRQHVRRAAVFRFHRFMPPLSQPVVSHWTTGCSMRSGLLKLHDASSEKGAVLEISRTDLLPSGSGLPLLRIVPESLVLISAGN